MDTTTIEASIKSTSDSTTIPSTNDSATVEQDKQPKKSVRVNKLAAVIVGFFTLAALIGGYLIFINPFPIYVIPMRILGLKLGYKFYDDPRNLVYFLYPKEGKVVQEADGTVIWKNSDENIDNAVAIMQPAKDPMPPSGCSELDKNIWECQDPLANSDAIYGSYYVKQSSITYLINFGIKQSERLKLARVGDDVFFSRVLQSLLLSPIQAPVTGNVEFLGHKIKLPQAWSISNTYLVMDDEISGLFNMPTSHVELIRGSYSISFNGPLAFGRGNCDTAILKRDEKESLSITYDSSVAILDDIFRVDIINSIDRNKYLSSNKKGNAIYGFGLCMPNTDPGVSRDNLESGSGFGYVSYEIPKNFDQKILDEMDGIIRDLAKSREETKMGPTLINSGGVCENIETKSSEKYEICNIGKDFQLRKSGNLILNHLSENYSVSPNKAKMAVWQYSNDYFENCVINACGGGPLGHTTFIIDFISGHVSQLIGSQVSLLDEDERKLADSVWSPDNEGLLLVNYDGVHYCTTKCVFIVESFCEEGCTSAYFKEGKIYYFDPIPDDNGNLKLKSLEWNAHNASNEP